MRPFDKYLANEEGGGGIFRIFVNYTIGNEMLPARVL